MNTFIDFSTAKLLKEKGFDNESAHYYNEKGEMLFDTYYPSLQPTKPGVYYDSPTIAEVVIWLYEKHSIWISILCDVGYDTLFTYKLYSTKIGSEHCIKNGDRYDSPTEAYESAIKYVLENLI